METAFDVLIRHSYITDIFDINHIALQRCVCKEWCDSVNRNSRDDGYLLKLHLDKNLLHSISFESTDLNVNAFLKFLITIRKNFDNDEKLKCLLDKENIKNIFIGTSANKVIQRNTLNCIMLVYIDMRKEIRLLPYISYVIYVYISNILYACNPAVLRDSCIIANPSVNLVCIQRADHITHHLRPEKNFPISDGSRKIVATLIWETRNLLQYIRGWVEMQSSVS